MSSRPRPLTRRSKSSTPTRTETAPPSTRRLGLLPVTSPTPSSPDKLVSTSPSPSPSRLSAGLETRDLSGETCRSVSVPHVHHIGGPEADSQTARRDCTFTCRTRRSPARGRLTMSTRHEAPSRCLCTHKNRTGGGTHEWGTGNV